MWRWVPALLQQLQAAAVLLACFARWLLRRMPCLLALCLTHCVSVCLSVDDALALAVSDAALALAVSDACLCQQQLASCAWLS